MAATGDAGDEVIFRFVVVIAALIALCGLLAATLAIVVLNCGA